MALIMYLTKAPRHENITAKEIELIESYFEWQHENEIGSRYSGNSFEKWCGVSESMLPDKKIIDYYRPFMTKKRMYVEGVGETEGNSLFEQLARIVKANQIFNWFITHVMDSNADQEYHEVTKKQFENLLSICNRVKDGFTFLQTNEYDEDEYSVDENIAKELLPLMEKRGYFFGPSNYGELYARQVIECIDIIRGILEKTDFKKEVVYFNAIW